MRLSGDCVGAKSACCLSGCGALKEVNRGSGLSLLTGWRAVLRSLRHARGRLGTRLSLLNQQPHGTSGLERHWAQVSPGPGIMSRMRVCARRTAATANPSGCGPVPSVPCTPGTSRTGRDAGRRSSVDGAPRFHHRRACTAGTQRLAGKRCIKRCLSFRDRFDMGMRVLR